MVCQKQDTRSVNALVVGEETVLNKWYHGYLWVALALFFPFIARLSTAPTVVDAIAFYVIGVVIWGSVLALVLYAWNRFRSYSNSPPKLHQESSPEISTNWSNASVTSDEKTIDSKPANSQHSDFRSQSSAAKSASIKVEFDVAGIEKTKLPTAQLDSVRSLEDYAYEVVAVELENNAQKKGIWTRVFAECNGDEKAMKVRYIKLRVEQLVAEELTRVESAKKKVQEEQENRNRTEQEEARKNQHLALMAERSRLGELISRGDFSEIEVPDEADTFLYCIRQNWTGRVKGMLELDIRYLAAIEGGSGNSVLHVAIAERNSAMAKLLIEYGASVTIKNGFYVSPLDAAKNAGLQDVVAAIEELKSQ